MIEKRSSPYRGIMAVGCLAVLFLVSGVVSAEGWSGVSALSLRGFGTLGFARSSNGQAEIVRDLSQPRGISRHWSGKYDSNLGLQANYLMSSAVEAVAQVVGHYDHKGKYTPDLTELLVKYNPNAYVTLRLGRAGTDFQMHGDTRMIGYSRMAVRPNIDFFSTLAINYLNGMDVEATLPLGGGLLHGKFYYGLLAEEVPFPTGHLDLRGSRSFGAYLDYQVGSWQWRGGMARIGFKHSMPGIGGLQSALRGAGVASAARAAESLELQGTNANFYAMGVVYDNGPLLLLLMANRLTYDADIIQGQDSLVFQAGYRIGEVKPFIGYSRTRSRRSRVATGLPDAGPAALINAEVAHTLAQSCVDQHTVSLGLRWDFRHNMALKLQADLVRGDADSVFTFRRVSPRWNGRMNVFSVALDFVF